MANNRGHPITEVGDVVIHHAAPRVWQPAAIERDGDLVGNRTPVQLTRAAALAAARSLLLPGHRIYIRHGDDAEWEEVGEIA